MMTLRARLTICAATALMATCLTPATLLGQEATLAVQRGTLYIGEPFVIQINAVGFEEEPVPEVALGRAPDGLNVKFLNVRPSVSSSITIINGRRTESRRVEFRFNYRVTALQPGAYRIPAATVKQGSKTVTTNPLGVRVNRIDIDPNMRVELIVPDGPVYPGQKVKVKIRWWWAGDASAINQLNIYSPMFDQFEFQDPPVRRGQSALNLIGSKGGTRVRAVISKETLDGKEYLVATAERVLLAEKVGAHKFDPIVVNVSKVVRWRRDVFGDRVPAAVRRIQARGKPAKLTIKPLPLKDRPGSFAGAIGSGFSMQVRASNTVVKVGDPITLTLTLRGDGRLLNAGLPPLFADGQGLDPKQFTYDQDGIPGEMTKDGKVFKVSVRVAGASVHQVPPIAYSWFDPELGRYKTTTSAPIAMQVGKARIVGAGDVVSGAPRSPENGGKKPAGQPTGQGAVSFDTSGADLAIVADTAGLLRGSADRFGGNAALIVVYALSLAGLGTMFILGRRASRDPQLVAARRNVRRQIARLRRAAGMSATRQAVEISGALGALASHVGPEMRDELDHIMRECDNLAFATSARDGSEGSDLHARAMALVKEAL